MQKRDLLLSNKAIYIIGREKEKKGPNKGLLVEVVKRRIDLATVSGISMSTLQDDFVAIHVADPERANEYDTLLDCVFKSEFVTLLREKVKTLGHGRDLVVQFTNEVKIACKKEGWGGGKTVVVQFSTGSEMSIKPSGSKLMVKVPQGLPSSTRPRKERPKSFVQLTQNSGTGRPAASAGRAGLVKAAQGPASSGGSKAATTGAPRRAAPPPPGMGRKKPPPKPKPQLPKFRALYDYEAQDADELNLTVGDVVAVSKKDPSGWWQGRLNGKVGLFPGNYVEEVTS